MRTPLLAAGAAGLVGGSTALAFLSGGYFEEPRIIAAIVAWVLLAVVAVVAPEPLPRSGAGRLALAGLLLLTAWTAASIAWAPIGGRAQDDTQRLLLYLAFFTVAIAVLRGPGPRRWLEPALALSALVVVGYALSERLTPGLVDLAGSRSAAGRLEQPISYWNALGLLAGFGVVLCAHIAGDLERGRALRAAAAAAGVPLGLGLYLTFARGALGACLAGLVVLLALAPQGRSQLRSIVAIVGAAVLAAVVANRYPLVKALEPDERVSTADGIEVLACLLLLSLAAAAIVLRRPRRRLPAPSLPVSRPAAVLGVALALLLSGGLAVAALEGKPEGTSPLRGADPSRLKSVDTNRYHYWREAGSTFAEHPIRGIGSGGFLSEWLRIRDRVDQSGDAHSLYLETAAELGIAGVAFLLMFLGGIVAAVVRLYRMDRGAAAGISGALVAWAFHAGLDWDWEMPAVTLPALLLAAAAIAWGEERAVEASPERGRAPARADHGERASAVVGARRSPTRVQ
jgi:hypothetical protein